MTETAPAGRARDTQADPHGWVIRAGQLVQRPDRRAVPDGAVVVRHSTITWAGPAGQLPAEDRRLPVEDHPASTIMPGLIETHAHLGSYTPHVSQHVSDPALLAQSLHILSALATARQLASVGVTTVQSLGARHYADVALREAIAAGVLAGPRILASGAQLTTTGGHSWTNGAEVDSIDDIRRTVRRHHKAGVDVIKVMATGGFMTPGTGPWAAQFSAEELRALVQEAHRLGKRTAAHAHGTEGIRRAVDAGIDYLAHASFVDPDGVTRFDGALADAIAERGIFVDTCAPPSWPPVPGETFTPRAKQLYEHGVGLVAGHDIGAVLPPSGYTFGLKQLEASGIPRAEVLTAATTRAAAALGLSEVTGELVAGRSADLIVVDGDPLESLDALDALSRVVIGGRPFVPDQVVPFDPKGSIPGQGPDTPGRVQASRNARWTAHRGLRHGPALRARMHTPEETP